ncbi:DUF based on E. rectale Gene description [uncultured Roseburia sp.]|uniref:DUF3881 family protein n=1 Tax=Brotonthovivens ammoniilytica TaxID=2981725 RepID=UPI000821CA73|nr:DUF3881 family protein [Brotonthovivens ammoniilytica]SCI41280.1 DUF based on E. rectale Gene description [uncultured Roseburia sp.]
MVHSFLRSIGFRNLKKKSDLYQILEDVINHPDTQSVEKDQNGNSFIECKKEFGEDFGIAVCGDFIDNHEFRMEHYYPYLIGTGITTEEEIEIERHAEKESYAGICDEMKLGVTLIFYVQNIAEVLKEQQIFGKYKNGINATLAGLAYTGRILLPVEKTEASKEQKKKSTENRIHLISKAREGNQAAMENLTLHDMDMYTSLSRRIIKEDILSIVETSFMPFGIESDQYMIIGEILDCMKSQNHNTGEVIWIMTLNCNDMIFDICVNEKDLLGEPEAGRRFKGRVWMQGCINYSY